MPVQIKDDSAPLSTTSYNNIFAAIVSTVRKEKKLSQKEVADKLGLTIAAISKLESGGTQVTFDHVYALAYALNVEPASLFQTLEVGVKSFIEGGGVLINNFYKNEGAPITNDTPESKPSINSHTVMIGTTAALGVGAAAAINPVVAGALLLGVLGTGFSKHLRSLITESNSK